MYNFVAPGLELHAAQRTLFLNNLKLHFSDCWHNSLLVGHCGPAPSSRVRCNNININMSQLGHCSYTALLYRNLGSKRMIIL